VAVRRGINLFLFREPVISSQSPRPGVRREEISIVHELGADLRAETIEKIVTIGPSQVPVRVKVESRVITQTAKAFHSSEYMATSRRRAARVLSTLILGLEVGAAREDFVVCTHPIVSGIGALMEKLQGASEEGNVREILRQVRNTFLDGGWESYRKADARRTAAAALEHLATAEEVTPRDVDVWFTKLIESGADPVGAKMFTMTEDDETDGEEEIPD
jgi:hypothetical protein